MAPSPPRHGGPPPAADPTAPRPGRVWYWVGGALIPLAFLTGLVLCAALLLHALTPPAFEARARGAASVGFTVDAQRHPDRTWLLYASPGGEGAGEGRDECVVTSPTGDDIAMGEPPFDHEVDAPGGGSWRLVGSFELTEEGEHTLTCLAPEASTHVIAYGEGSQGWRAAGVAGAVAALFLVPMAGLAAGTAVIVLTVTQRSRHRRFLAGAGTGPAPQGPPRPPPPEAPGPRGTQPPPGAEPGPGPAPPPD